MPGKTCGSSKRRPSATSFNEAPAKCRGKQLFRSAAWAAFSACFNEAPAKCRGKHGEESDARAPARASMRPQRNAGENAPVLFLRRGAGKASMRPQRNAGENAGSCGRRNSGPTRFNEAPAKCRGKRWRWSISAPERQASMRPQRNAGENGGSSGEN